MKKKKTKNTQNATSQGRKIKHKFGVSLGENFGGEKFSGPAQNRRNKFFFFLTNREQRKQNRLNFLNKRKKKEILKNININKTKTTRTRPKKKRKKKSNKSIGVAFSWRHAKIEEQISQLKKKKEISRKGDHS